MRAQVTKKTAMQVLMILALFGATHTEAMAKRPKKAPTAPEPPTAPEEPPSTPVQPLSGIVKVEVAHGGLVELTASQIAIALYGTTVQAATEIANRTLRIRSMGNEVSWLPAADNSSLYFYGRSIDASYGGNNVYWIEVGTAGTVMSSSGGRAPKSASLGGVFVESESFEEDVWSIRHLNSDPTDDSWCWGYTYTPSAEFGTTTHTISTPGAVAGGTATITLNLRGGMDTAASPDHHARAYINGTLVGEGTFDATESYALSAPFSQSLLNDGSNEVVLESVTGSSVSLMYIDSIDVTYTRLYKAVGGSLALQGDGNATVTVEEFGGSDIEVFDISDLDQPVRITATKVEVEGVSHRVSFKPSVATTPYLAVRLSQAGAPASIAAYTPAGLLDASNAAEYVVIAPDLLVEAAMGLTAYRESQGMSTKIVCITDIYDEFNEGIRDPMAIQAFLAHALSQWAVAPRYVVLAGEGSYDYNNVTGNGDCLVPSMFISTAFGLELSDSRLADIDGDRAPEVAIGRLPVLTAEELQGVVTKIIAYEAGGAWKNRLQMITDNPDAAGDYVADADELSQLAAPWMTVDKAYLGQQTLSDVRNAALTSLSSGSGILNYVGHGYHKKLANEGILKDTDLATLSNADNAPVVLSMSCDVGEFGVPGSDSLSEQLVAKSDGGAVAVWANATGANSGESQILSSAFHQALASGLAPRLGDAIKVSQENYSQVGHSLYQGYCYNLLGDPATLVDGTGGF